MLFAQRSFDTADVYGPSEAIVGQYLRLNPGRRPQVQLMSKISFMGVEAGDLHKDVLEYQVPCTAVSLLLC